VNWFEPDPRSTHPVNVSCPWPDWLLLVPDWLLLVPAWLLPVWPLVLL